MFTDPITVDAINTLTLEATGPVTGSPSNWDGVLLNRIRADGPQGAIYVPSAAVLASLSLASASLRVQHTSTNQGRVRSLFRVDVSKLDALQKSHGTSFQLVVDSEAAVSAERQAVLVNALELFSRLLYKGDGDLTDVFRTTDVFSQYLNGES